MAAWLDLARGQRSADAAAHTAKVGEALDAYLDKQKRAGRAEATLEIDRQKAGHLVRLWGRNMPLHLVTAKCVHDYIATREREGASSNTIARELVVLRGMLKLAIHLGRFTMPLERVMPLEYDARYEPRKRWISEAQAWKLLEELPEDNRGWFAFALATGARKSEVERFELADVVQDENGEMEVFIRGTKTEASEGTIPITSVQQPWLDAALEYATEPGPAFGVWTNVLRGLEHACLRLQTCEQCRRACLLDPLKRARGTPMKGCAGCEAMPAFPKKLSPNDLRRSLGFWLRDGGVDPHLIGKILRHVDSRMAERVYARGSRQGLREVIEAQLAVRKTVRRFVRHGAVPVRPRRQERRPGA